MKFLLLSHRDIRTYGSDSSTHISVFFWYNFWLFPGCVIWDFDVYDIMFLGKILIIREFSHSKLITVIRNNYLVSGLNEFPNKQIFYDQFHFNQLLIGVGKWQKENFFILLWKFIFSLKNLFFSNFNTTSFDLTYQNVQNVFVMQNKIQVGLNYVNAISSNHVMNKTFLPQQHFFTKFLSYFYSQYFYTEIFSVIHSVIYWDVQLFTQFFFSALSYIELYWVSESVT